MECWKEGCINKVKVLCKCVEPACYSCKVHMYKHGEADSIGGHNFEYLELKPNQIYKEALIEELNKLSKELLDIKENLIKETHMKIQELKLLLIKALENIEKIRINQADLIRKINSVKNYQNKSKSTWKAINLRSRQCPKKVEWVWVQF
ncbi:unnamed protein product [Blepharisma stoltei]|uniref:B box-type domain-containing protein n=1 Tax=Blepharisma stoltei TaxID=1481888 RepID=A0AAU9JTV8_9CILI|nr:unnamed protein product [Blepharisma stoltei]